MVILMVSNFVLNAKIWDLITKFSDVVRFVTCDKHEFNGVDCSHHGNVSSSIAHGLDCYIEALCHCLKDAPREVRDILTSLYSLGPYLYPMEIEFSILVGKFDNSCFFKRPFCVLYQSEVHFLPKKSLIQYQPTDLNLGRKLSSLLCSTWFL